MKNRKNIDKLFEEGFKNFEPTPSPRVWENIQAGLNREKRNRKSIPLWIKYGGVAAVLALLLTVGGLVYNFNETVPNSITDENFIDPAERLENNNFDAVPSQTPLANEESIENASPSKNSEFVSNNVDHEPPFHKKTVVSTKVGDNVKHTTPNSKKNRRYDLNKEKGRESASENGIAASHPDSGFPESQDGRLENTGDENKGNKMFFDPLKENLENSDKRISIAETPDNSAEDSDIGISNEVDAIPDHHKISILDAIAQNDEVHKNTQNEKQLESRWAITPNVAPVYYGSIGNGSSIDPDFTNNPQKGDVNMSYGLKVSYALNSRLSIRTGLQNMDLSYSTSDIVIGTGPVARALGSVDYGSKQTVVTAIPREKLIGGNAPSNGFGDLTLKSTGSDARLIQNINYYEIPVELKYAVLDSRFGINLVGGVSTLFLGNNEVSVRSENFSSVLGKANNLSEISFSTNIGLGIDYKLSKKFIFNIEPMFKYQLNPYTDSSVNFKPYYLGVYSGLSFKF